MFNEKYPATDFNEYNLDWIIREIRKMHKDWSDFRILNTIRFEGLWNITSQYPAWSLVTDNNNVGYISVQPVPAGVNITNTDYWKEVYDYNAILPDIMQRIVDLENAVNNIDNTEIPGMQNDISNLQGDVLTMQGQISTLEDAVSKDRYVVWIGDSYLEGYSIDGNTTPFSTYCKNYYESMTSATMTNYVFYKGGVGFLNTVDGKNFNVLLNDAINAITDADDITDVIVAGGYNDGGYTIPDLNTAINTFATTAKTAFPNATLWISACGYDKHSNIRKNIEHVVIPAYTGADVEKKFRIMSTTIRIFHKWSLLDSEYKHPCEAGQSLLGSLICLELLGSPANINDSNNGNFESCSYTLNSPYYQIPSLSYWKEAKFGDMICIDTDMDNFKRISGVIPATNTSDGIALMSIDSKYLGGELQTHEFFYETTAIATGGGSYTPVIVKFYIDVTAGGTSYLKIHCAATNAAGNNWRTDITEIFGLKMRNITVRANSY